MNISFELASLQPVLEALLKCEFKEEKYKTASHFIKEMDNKTVMLVQTKDKYIIVQGLADKEPQFLRGPKTRRIERIHENRYWDGQLLLSSHTKNNVLDVLMLYKSKPLTLQANLRYQQGRVLFKKPQAS